MASSNLPQGSMGDPASDNQARHGDQAKHGNLASHGEPFFSVAEALHLQQSVIGKALLYHSFSLKLVILFATCGWTMCHQERTKKII